MARIPTKQSISPTRRKLLELCQWLNFGRLEQLNVREGEPQFSPPPKVIREFKFRVQNAPRPEWGSIDFQLKPQTLELFRIFDERPWQTINVLVIKDGLPFSAETDIFIDFTGW